MLSNLRALRGLNDPLSVDNEPFYIFYRTLKRWTTEIVGGSFAPSGDRIKWGVLRGGGEDLIRACKVQG